MLKANLEWTSEKQICFIGELLQFVNVCLSVPTGMFVSRKGLHELNHKNLSFLTVYGLGTNLNSFGCIM